MCVCVCCNSTTIVTGGLRKLSIYSEIEKTKVGGRISLSTDSK